ncbi:hypothetical protein DKX38_011302 [Salix brachista]|uniref:P-type Cu(+) transporter n=1 Tax=Salix brachista TaxID=2182728 RepID=A0A5N5M137_9ROSI|nr:hypothetical protein DKX38_011302 [Salix brachista]
MERLMSGDFDVKAKHSSEEALQKWRKLCGVVKNPKRRFRFTANLSKRYEAAAMRKTNQEKLRIAVLVSKAAFQFIQGVSPSDYNVPAEVKAAGFDICADELGSIVESHDVKKLKFHGGVTGVSQKLCTSVIDGLTTADSDLLNRRQEIYGINKFAESQPRSFWVFVWEALQDMTLMILGVCAFVSLIVGIATEGWLEGAHDGLGIVASILLVVFVTATSDYRQSLQFRDLDTEKKKIIIQVVDQPTNAASLVSEMPVSAVKLLLQSIFNNTGGEVAVNKDGKREILGTPTETALLEFGLSLNGDFQEERQAVKLVKVEPFNSTKKRMGVVVELHEGGLRAHTKGASEIVLAACDKVINSNGDIVPLDEESINLLNGTIDQFASEALRTLCLAYMELEGGFSPENPMPVSGYTCIGIVGIKDPVRPGVKESVAVCRSAGITVRMVTGDNINTAKAIARECGILTDDGIAIEGPDFREKSLEELLQLVPKIQSNTNRSAIHRIGKIVPKHDFQAKHYDSAGYLDQITVYCWSVAKESADVIILDDNFSTIVTVAKWGRSVYINIQKFVQFQLTVNVVALIVNFSSACLTGRFNSNGNVISRTEGLRIFNEISSREMEEVDVFKGILDNYVFVVVIGGTVLSQIIIVEFLGTFANTTPLTFAQWFLSVLIGFLGMPIAAGLKKIPV